VVVVVGAEVGVTSTAVIVEVTAVVPRVTTVAGGAATSVVETTVVDALSVPTVEFPPAHADTSSTPKATDVTMRLIR
jgi:hypothetical protein